MVKPAHTHTHNATMQKEEDQGTTKNMLGIWSFIFHHCSDSSIQISE